MTPADDDDDDDCEQSIGVLILCGSDKRCLWSQDPLFGDDDDDLHGHHGDLHDDLYDDDGGGDDYIDHKSGNNLKWKYCRF